MKMGYKRDLNHNYLMIEAEEEFFEYQVKMITANKIEGLLECIEERVDNKVDFLYEISSKQPFIHIFERSKLNYDMFCSLILCLRTAVENVGEYLLDVNSLLISPEYIYMNPETKDVQLIYVPGLWKNIKEEFHELSRQLLDWIDYNDERVVKATYELFRQTSEENYTIENILSSLELNGASHSEPGSDSGNEYMQVDESFEEPEQVTGTDMLWQMEEEKPSIIDKIKAPVFEAAEYILKLLSSFQKKSRDVYSDEEENDTAWDRSGIDIKTVNYEDLYGQETIGDNLEEYSTYGMVAEEAVYGDTVFFQSEAMEKNPRLISGRPDEFDDFSLTIFPFIIGKLTEAVDGIIEDNSVSRIHAKIEKDDNRFCIVDLNSTNGTFLNGQILSPNEKTKLQAGDCIQFGLVEYHFEC